MLKISYRAQMVWLLWLAFLQPAWAGDQPLTYDRVNLSVTVSDEVENDTLVAVLYSEHEGNDAARLATEVNKDVSWAVGEAKGAAGIKVQTLDYRTSPIYRKQVLSGWRVRQSLRLESQDGPKLSELIGDLQKRLAVNNISYAVSPERRKQVEDRLIAEAMASFKARAQLIAKQLDYPQYRLVQMDVNTGGAVARPQLMRAMAESAPPALEAGTQQVQLTVSGMIELQAP